MRNTLNRAGGLLAAGALLLGAVAVVGATGSPAANADPVPVGDVYVPLSPTRLADTRTDGETIDEVDEGEGAIGAGEYIDVTITGRATIPADDVVAVALNVTAVDPSAQSFLTVFDNDGEFPLASNVNFTAGQTAANMVIAKVAADGTVSVFNSAGSTHVIVDVLGYYMSTPTVT